MSPIRGLWQAMAAQRKELALAGLLGGLASLCAVALLGTAAWLISQASEYPPVLTLTVAAVLVRTFALGRAFLRYAERLVGHDAAFRGLTELRVRVYERLERISPVGLGRFTKGDLLNRLVLDVDAALDLPLRIVLPWAQAVFVSVITVAFLAWLLPGVGLIVGLIVVLALIVSPLIIGRTTRRAEYLLAPSKAELTSVVVTALNSCADLSANGRILDTTTRAHIIDDSITALSRRESFALGIGGAIATVLQGLAICVTLVIAIPAVASGRIEPVWLAVVALLPLALIEVLATLPGSALAYARLEGSADRIAGVMDSPDPVVAQKNPMALDAGPSDIAIRDLSVSWSTARVLNGISFDLLAGHRLAVVGPSGSGKSTLAAALMGFLPYEGSARIEGIELSSVLGDDLREHISVLSQQAHIFDTTIDENIRLGREIDESAVWRSLEQAQLAVWARSLPDGLQTSVGTFGMSISGGEAQRLALARFLVQPRPVVILDEPTEHLDRETAQELENTLFSALTGFTTIVITHRLSSLQRADNVIVLQAGVVSERGTVEELSDRGGWFSKQLKSEEEDLRVHSFISQLPIGRGAPVPHATGFN
ncbi:MAG: thiol reductant ABC exporter subunit CydC [Candidatus Nanopelagicales bacterium]